MATNNNSTKPKFTGVRAYYADESQAAWPGAETSFELVNGKLFVSVGWKGHEVARYAVDTKSIRTVEGHVFKTCKPEA